MEQNEQIVNMNKWVSPRLNKFEIFLVAFFCLFCGLNNFTNLSYDFIVVIPIGSLAILYFISAFVPKENQNSDAFALIIPKVAFISLSVAVIGILYWLMKIPSSFIMLLAPSITILIGLIYTIYLKVKKPKVDLFDKRMLLRLVAIFLISIYLIFFHWASN
jgi:hypothetical protein